MRTAVCVIVGGVCHTLLVAAPLLATGRHGAVARPAVAVFFVLATLFYLAELTAMAHAGRRSNRVRTLRDRRIHLLSLLSCLAVLAVFWTALLEASRQPAPSIGRIAAAAAIMGAGAALRGWAIHQLAERFTTTLPVIGEGPLAQNGAYAWVRHPSETGLLLVALGGALLVGGTFAVAMWLGLLLPLTLLRVQIEEQGLLAAFGPEFRAYRQRVRALIPFVI